MPEVVDEYGETQGRVQKQNAVHMRKKIVICFDGTGNKFQGDASDSNILKIYSMLDQQDENQVTYYQPGIGTYVESSSLTKTSRLAKIRSWYLKAKDQAVGISLDSHVVAAYKFLMRYYSAGDDIFMFGFSRGAYTARFLAQMLDCVGLLAAGNEENVRFAWKTFARWQTRREGTEEERKKAAENYRYMQAFRQTFSRPVRRIRFLGLFDTVNSVPRFESAWMQRSKFPYRSRSSAKVVRHAVAIDERRAKFRQDLISEQAPDPGSQHHHHPHLHLHHYAHDHKQDEEEAQKKKKSGQRPTLPRAASSKLQNQRFAPRHHQNKDQHLKPQNSTIGRDSNLAPSPSMSQTSFHSNSPATFVTKNEEDDDEKSAQDIQEVWFPGDHADIGGGWSLNAGGKDERVMLSHAPLIWMIREARKAGLSFDHEALKGASYIFDEDEPFVPLEKLTKPSNTGSVPELRRPTIKVEGQEMNEFSTPPQSPGPAAQGEDDSHGNSALLRSLDLSARSGIVHDTLRFGGGIGIVGSLTWSLMEYMPFRRMDLRPDGKWEPIRWPLPCGEPRDVPMDAVVHRSAIQKIMIDPNYRPGNIIVGGGGRGVRRAPASAGTGNWIVLREEGNPVGEVYVRKDMAENILNGTKPTNGQHGADKKKQ